MLVTCKNCGVSFAPSLVKCVACGVEHVPSAEERAASLTVEAEQWLQAGGRRQQVLDRLTGELGCANRDAEEILSRAIQGIRRRSRQQGRHMILSGVVLLVGAALVSVLTLALAFASGVFVVASGLLLWGALLIVFGTIKATTGWNITGHDDDDDDD